MTLNRLKQEVHRVTMTHLCATPSRGSHAFFLAVCRDSSLLVALLEGDALTRPFLFSKCTHCTFCACSHCDILIRYCSNYPQYKLQSYLLEMKNIFRHGVVLHRSS